MILYHGSNIEIDEIKLDKCKPFKDFGRGFYLTTIKEQAMKMAYRITKIYGGSPVVTIFEFDDKKLNMLDYKQFNTPTMQWAEFVLNNRNRDYISYDSLDCNHDNKYDVVLGPIANDDLALLFRQFSTGIISIEILTKEMEYKKLTNQYSFHTLQAIKYLKKIGKENG